MSSFVTETEQSAGVTIAQDMMYLCRTMKAICLNMKLPMIYGAVYFANNQSVGVGGRIRY